MRTSLLVSSLALLAALGCGSGINSRDNSSIAKISGTLTGSTAVPAGARVAIVWHSPTGAFVVSNEAPIVGGSFSIDLSSPPSDDLFFSPDDAATRNSDSTAPSVGGSSGSGGTDTGGAAPAPSGGSSSGGSARNVSIKDVVSGGISNPMTVAVAGFVLYVDKNANGHLDLTGDTADSPDQIIGGGKDLLLTYLRDGSNLDLERLRDTSGQLPSRGYDLVLANEKRWVPLSAVEINLDFDRLPDQVCYVHAISGSSGGGVAFADPPPDVATTTPKPADPPPSSSSSSSGSSGSSGGDPNPSYPPAGDPGIHCGPDGTYFTYGECPPPPPPKAGLCRGYEAPMGCAEAYYTVPSPVPSNWPCPITKPDADGGTDAGPAPDAGADGGS